ncbi:MAG: tetratricopeptide repeat protein [Acutalibacteraceae bacterium]
MDELKKGDLTPEESAGETDNEKLSFADTPEDSEQTQTQPESEAASAPEEQTSEEDALNTELEQIRDMFQKELDNAKNSDNSDMLIQELDEIEEEADEPEQKQPDPKDLCQCCGEKIRDTSFGDDYPYCSDCRELMKANPINSLGIIALIVMIFIAGFSLSRAVVNVSSWNDLLDANISYTEGKYVDAASQYQAYLQSADTSDGISVNAVKNLSRIYASLSYYSYAQQTVDSYFPASRLKLPWNKEFSSYNDLYEQMQAAQTIVTDNFEDVLSGVDFDYEESLEKADKLIEENKKDENCGKFTLAYLEYAKYIIMSSNGDSYEKQLEQLKKVEETDAGQLPLLYYTDILSVYSNMGDTENAKVYFDKLMEINKQDTYTYTYYANAFRFCDKPDADKMLEIAQEAAKNSSANTFPYYYKTYTVAYLLQEKYDEAYTNFELYLQNLQSYGGSAGVADYNLYALCALAAGEEDTYNQIKTMFEDNGMEISSLIQKYEKGKLTMTEVLTDKGGEIA